MTMKETTDFAELLRSSTLRVTVRAPRAEGPAREHGYASARAHGYAYAVSDVAMTDRMTEEAEDPLEPRDALSWIG
jgi:hypothetical protein